MQNPVGWFEIYINNAENAKKFYETVFGVKLERLSDPTDTQSEMWAFGANYETYGAAGALIKMDGFSAGGNSTVVYFSCEDCAVEESRVEAAGGKVQQSKFSIGEYGFCALVEDQDGNVIGLHSQK